MCCIYKLLPNKVIKTARIRNRYNQVPHLSQDCKWKSNKTTMNITNKSKEVSPFPSGDHKAAMNRRESMTNTRLKLNKRSTKEVPPCNGQKKYFTVLLRPVSWRANLTLGSQWVCPIDKDGKFNLSINGSKCYVVSVVLGLTGMVHVA